MNNQPLQRFCTNCGHLLAPGARRRGCGCLLLALLLIGLFLVVVVTYGLLCQIFIYVAAGLFSLCVLLFLIGMLATRGGHEILGEAATEGCLEALLGGLFAEQAIARIAHKENPDLKEEPDWTFKLAPAPLRVRDRELLFLLLA